MSDQTTNLGLPYLAAAQAQKHVSVNQALQRLDALVQTAVESRSLAVEPANAADGAVWITPPGKTGLAWDAFADNGLAYYRDGVWEKLDPRVGWRVWVKDEARLLTYDGSGWREPGAAPDPRNHFRNPSFDVWQRGTSLTGMVDGAYGPDGVRLRSANGRTIAMSRQATPAADRDLIRSPYLLRWSLSGVGTGYGSAVALVIESAEPFADTDLTVTFKLKGSTDSALTPRIRRNHGSGGSSENVFAADDITVTTSFVEYSATVALSSIEDKTIGAGSYIALEFVTPSGLSGDIDYDFAEVQVVVGATAPPFVREDPGLSLIRCQRYFQSFGGDSSLEAIAQIGGYSSTVAYGAFLFPQEMRAAPTVDFSGASVLLASSTALSVTSAAFATITPRSMRVQANAASGLASGVSYLWRWNSDATGRLTLSAELV